MGVATLTHCDLCKYSRRTIKQSEGSLSRLSEFKCPEIQFDVELQNKQQRNEKKQVLTKSLKFGKC